MKKHKNKIFLGMATCFVLFFCFTNVLLALGDYTPLAPLPQTLNSNNQTNFATYLPGIFNLTIGIAAFLAFVMITYGGIQYMTSDALNSKEEGRNTVTNAIYGLLLVIGAWVILNTINPKILSFSIGLKPPVVQGEVVGDATPGRALPGYTLTADQVTLNNQMRADLKNNYHVDVNAGPCADGQTSGCTNLVGLPNNAYVGVTNVEKECGGCYVEITGGTEGGHVTHGPNLPNIDLAINSGLDKYITDHAVSSVSTSIGTQYTVQTNGVNATFLRESNPPHWHVVFK